MYLSGQLMKKSSTQKNLILDNEDNSMLRSDLDQNEHHDDQVIYERDEESQIEIEQNDPQEFQIIDTKSMMDYGGRSEVEQ